MKILQKSNESWWWVELNGCQGYVPVNHLTAESPQQAYWQDEEYFGNYSSLVRQFKIKVLNSLTLCNLMDFPIQINTMRMGLSIVYFKGSSVEIFY